MNSRNFSHPEDKKLDAAYLFLSHILEQPKCFPGKAFLFPKLQLGRVRTSRSLTPELMEGVGVVVSLQLAGGPDGLEH